MSLRSCRQSIINCRQCHRLVAWREEVAEVKRAAYRHEDYWGRPVPGWGAPNARLLIVGLAPGAHGANRTGRMFTGDRSGDWLYRAMNRAGFANQPNSVSIDDRLELQDAFVSAVVRCAPPGNKPTPGERDTCLPFLIEELMLLCNVRVILPLGKFAWDGTVRALSVIGASRMRHAKFGHGVSLRHEPYTLIGSYHPSQQNTLTGRLTERMLDDVFTLARRAIEDTM